MLLEYIFLHFGATRSVYDLCTFTYGPICPYKSISLHLPYVALVNLAAARYRRTPLPPPPPGALPSAPAHLQSLPAAPCRASWAPHTGYGRCNQPIGLTKPGETVEITLHHEDFYTQSQEEFVDVIRKIPGTRKPFSE